MDQATLMDKIKTGTTLCKAIMRNGYDAYAINAPLQGLIFEKTGVFGHRLCLRYGNPLQNFPQRRPLH